MNTAPQDRIPSRSRRLERLVFAPGRMMGAMGPKISSRASSMSFVAFHGEDVAAAEAVRTIYADQFPRAGMACIVDALGEPLRIASR